MFKRSTSSITNLKKLSVIIVSLAILASVFIGSFKSDNFVKRSDQAEGIGQFAQEMEKRWLEGDVEELYERKSLNCPELISNDTKVHPSYFQCNPYYMQCFLRSLNKKSSGSRFQLEHTSFDENGNLIASFKDKKNKGPLSLKFKDTCSKIRLKPSVYSASPVEGEKYVWDNIGQSIDIDAHYVNNGEVLIWANKINLTLPDSPKHAPSTNLSHEQKKLYCAFKGGQLLQSRQFDAATFLPAKARNNFVYKFPYPWSKRKDAIDRLGKKNCSKIFSKECSSEEYEYHSTYGASWSGVYHSLGSFIESFDNKFLPLAKYKMSSKDFALDSPWHRLGVRGSDESDKEIHLYNGGGIRMPEKELRSAFRCVYYR